MACVCAGISHYPTAEHGPIGYHGPLAKPVVLKDGHIADTHEVAAARSAHLAAVAKAPQGHDGGHDGGYGGHDGGFGGGYGGGYGGDDGHGHLSYGPGTHDVYKGEHGYAGLESVHHGQEHGHGHGGAGFDGGFDGGYGAGHGGDGGHAAYGGYVYHGPLAAPVVLKSGYLADTHDVAAAKGAHLVALEKAHAHGGWDGDYHH